MSNIPGYKIVPVECCYNCNCFFAHWCQDQDNDKCELFEKDVDPNGWCPKFQLNEDITSPKSD